MRQLHKRLVLNKREDWQGGLFFNIEHRGDSLALKPGAMTAGRCILPPIDSGEQGFSWRRVSLECFLPEDSMIRAYAFASDSGLYEGEELSGVLSGLDLGSREADGFLRELFGEPIAGGEDFYLDRTGRRLWLMLELVSTGGGTPELRSVSIELAGDHMVDYLPAIYQESGDFTRRFLSVFDSVFMDMESRIYDLPQLFDYENTSPEMLRYLAEWVCIDSGELPEAELIARISTAIPDFEDMYTVEGVKRTVRRLTGRTPMILESADVDPNSPDCANSALMRRLYGEDPYRFFILLEEDTFKSRSDMELFLERMRRLIPAGCDFELVLLKRCVQLDWHTYLGINSMVGSYVAVAIDENKTIHYDTMIGGDEVERS